MNRCWLVIWPLILVAVGAGAPLDKGNSICYEVQNDMNTLVDYTQTRCWSAPSDRDSNLLSFIVISSKPIFSVEAAKKGWVLGAVAAIGKTLNDAPSVKTDQLWLSDANLMKKQIAYVLPTSLARSLQREAFQGRIGVETMYARIRENLIEKTITKDVPKNRK